MPGALEELAFDLRYFFQGKVHDQRDLAQRSQTKDVRACLRVTHDGDRGFFHVRYETLGKGSLAQRAFFGWKVPFGGGTIRILSLWRGHWTRMKNMFATLKNSAAVLSVIFKRMGNKQY